MYLLLSVLQRYHLNMLSIRYASLSLYHYRWKCSTQQVA